EGHVVAAPAVLALHGPTVGGEGVHRVVDEELARARIGSEDHRWHAHLVDLRTAPLRNHLLQGLRDRLADLGAGMMGSGRHRPALGRVQTAALGTISSIESKKPSFFGMVGSIIEASCATT